MSGDWVKAVLSIVPVLIIGAVILALLWVEFPLAVEKILHFVLGSMVMVVKDVYGFWFGASENGQGERSNGENQ